MPDSRNLYPIRFLYAFLAVLAWSPLPKASNRVWSQSLLCILIMSLAMALVAYTTYKNKNPLPQLSPHKWPVLLLGVVALWTTFQTIPLPFAVIDFLSPNAAAIYEMAQLDRFTLSLEPSETLQMAILSWSLWLFFVMTILLADSPDRMRLLMHTIVLCGVFQAVYGSFMTLSGLEYGFFHKKEFFLGRATGTFVARAHLAGYLEMCLAVGIGLLVASLSRRSNPGWRKKLGHVLDTLLGPKMRLRIFLALMVIALVLTRSRMGNTAFFIALPVCGIGMMLIQGKLNRGAIILIASLMLVDFLIVGQWFGFDELAERIENTSAQTENRDETIRDTLTMLQDYPLTGTGNGTYFSAFPQYQGPDIGGFWDHAHNDYLEFAVELGAIGFAPLALLVILSLIKSITFLKKRHDQLARGVAFAATMGIMSLLIHSTVDFNLHIPANALLFIVILAMASIAGTLPRTKRHKDDAGERDARSTNSSY